MSSFPNPTGVTESSLPSLLQTCGVGTSLVPQGGQGMPEGPVQALPSLPPARPCTSHTHSRPVQPYHVFGSPRQIPTAKALQSTWQSDFPSKSCWFCQDGSGSWLWKGHKGCTRWPELSHKPSWLCAGCHGVGALAGAGGISWIPGDPSGHIHSRPSRV